MCILSFWIHRSFWLWGAFLGLSLSLAIRSGIANPFSLIPLASLGVIHFPLQRNVAGIQRWALVLMATCISVILIRHWLPTFSNWHVEGKFWISYDKPFIGIFVLAFTLPLLRSRAEWGQVLIKAVPLTILGIGAMIFLAGAAGVVTLDPKWPPHFLLRVASNLILVTIPEEAFYRGFLQEELFKRFGQGFKGGLGAIGITSLFFMAMHISWSPSLGILAFTFVASLLYGAIYQYTRAVEGSIFCHFLLNMTHLIFFSYHAL
jgi:membrane protease YdiL (CAAX protease family)